MPPQHQRPQGDIEPDIVAQEFIDVLNDFAELASDERGDESVGDDTPTTRTRRSSTSTSEERSAVNPFQPAANPSSVSSANPSSDSVNPAQLVDMFDKVFKGHDEMVEKRRRDKCVYCTDIGVSSKKEGYKYTHYYCATCKAYVHPKCWIKFHRCQIVEATSASQE